MIGTKLSDRYELTGELGRGGMGVVYRAKDPVLGRDVAVKVIPPTHVTPDTEERFRREAQLVAQMDHPGIVPIYDFGRHGDSLFLVMPVIPGTSLRTFLREGTVTLGEVLEIGIQVADALDNSHGRGVIHRDVKPENVMVSRTGGGVRARVMDFGLAMVATQARMTQTGVVVGTMGYLSPEQVRSKAIDHRSDIYSLGTVLYECLAGSPPFAGDIQSVLYRIVHELPQPPSASGAAVPNDVEMVVMACLARDPAERPQTARDVAESLRNCQSRMRDSDRLRSVMATSSTHIARPAAAAPFVGRVKELAELQGRLAAAIAGECQLVVVGGEPGCGKTRLADEIDALARARHVRVLHGRFFEQDRAFPYQGFCEAVQEYFRGRGTGSSTETPDFTDLLPELVALSPVLAEIADVKPGSASHVAQPPAPSQPEDRTHVFELIARTLMRIAAGKPLVLILEDLHHAEVSLEALQYVVRRLGPTPTLVVGTYRTTDVEKTHPLNKMLKAFHGDRRFVTTTLGPFTPSEHRTFVETLVGAQELSDELVVRLYEGTEGNPFFTKELVRSLMDSGTIARDDTGMWALSGATALGSDSLPATIQQAVEGRIERLPQDLRDVLAVAAVLGRTFDFRDLEALAEGDSDVEDATDRLILEGILEEERESRGDRLAFASGVVRDVLLAQVSRRGRRTLHRRCAEQIEKRMAGKLDRAYPELVYHFAEGDVPEKTVEYASLLARRAIEGFSPEDAVRAARTALEFVDAEWEGAPTAEGDLRLLLARAHRMSGDAEAAVKQAESAAAVFEREHMAPRAVESLLLAAEAAWQARRTDDAARLVARGLDAARAAGANDSLAQLLSLAATLANLRGEYERANEHLREAERLTAGARNGRAAEPQGAGGRVVVALASAVGATEPVRMEVLEDAEVLTNVFETLLAVDEGGALTAALCERWAVEGGGRMILLTLRRGVRFQDGHELCAADVKSSFERAIRGVARQMPAAFGAIAGIAEFRDGRADGVTGLVVRSGAELEVRLSESLPIYPSLLTDFYTGVVRAADDGSVVGTGPFRVASRTQDSVVLERSASYWREKPALVDAVEFRPGMASSAIAAGLRGGEIDLARDLAPRDLDEILRDARFRRGLVEAPQKNTYFLVFRGAHGSGAANANVRRALAGALRSHDPVWETLGRFAQPAVCLIPPGILGHDPGRKGAHLTRDEASAIVGGAAPAPISLKASVHPVLQDRCSSLLDALWAIWADLGVSVEAPRLTMPQFLETWEDPGAFDVVLSRWNADYDDPDAFTYELFHSKAGRLARWFSGPETDRLLEEARAESRPRAREALYRKFESALADTGSVLPLFHDVQYRVASPRMRGLRLRGSAPYVNYSEIRVEEGAPESAEAARAAVGTLRIPIAGTVQTLEPARVTTVEETEVSPCVFETLMRHGEDLRIVPWLAADVRVEGGGTRYAFRLRDDVHFHDGRRLSARDVRFSWERMLKNSALNRRLLAPIRGAAAFVEGAAGELAGFRIHSATSFEVELERPIAYFPAVLSHPAMGIVPENADPEAHGVVGTGPFRIAQFEPGRALELERNPQYWRAGFPKSARLSFVFGVPPKDILSEFRAGRFSLCSDLLPSDVEALRRDPALASGFRQTPHLSTYLMVMNTRKGPLADRALRAELAASIDAPTAVRHALGRLATPAAGLIPPGLAGHVPAGAPRPAAAPVARRGAPVQLTAAVHHLFLGRYTSLREEGLRAMHRAGFEIRRVNNTMQEYLQAVKEGTTDLVIGRWVADFPDADTFASGVIHSRDGFFGNVCGSPELDALIERGRTESDNALRHGVYRRFEETLAKDVRVIPLFHEQVYRFARPEVEGLSVSYWTPVVRYDELRVRG